VHRRQRKATVEAEAVAAEVAPGVLVKVEGMEGPVEAGFGVAQQRVDPAELQQIAGVLPTSDDGLMAAARSGDGTEEGQAIREHLAAESQVLSWLPDTSLKPLRQNGSKVIGWAGSHGSVGLRNQTKFPPWHPAPSCMLS
jgi:hypothetical protein